MSTLGTQFQQVGDARIAYREHGAGPALVLLHGNSESKSLLSRYQTDYFKDFHTFALDSRGHGETISTDEAYSIHQYSQDVIGFCRAKGLSKAFVIGYSDGGNIALFLARDAPDLFPRIIAISPNTLVSGTEAKSLRAMQAAARLLRLLGRLGFHTRKALLRFDLMLNDIGLPAEELRRIQTSVRILYAEHDMIKEEHILEISRQISSASVQKIADCNHMNIIHKPEAIADMRRYFLGVSPSKAG